MQEILEHGRPLRGWLGIEAQMITPQIARALELKDTAGVVVVGVVRGGPAHSAGLQPGDVLVAIDGSKIIEAREALLSISGHKPGSRVKMEVLRDGKPLVIEATAIERPAQAAVTE
jgi:serine protease DegS